MWFLSSLPYSDHVAYISFIFIRLSNFSTSTFYHCHEIYLDISFFGWKISTQVLLYLNANNISRNNNNNGKASLTTRWRRQKVSGDRRKNVIFGKFSKLRTTRKRRRSGSKFFGHKIIMLSCRWWKIVCPTLPSWEGAASEEGRKKFLVILNIIYWFIIINENETWSKVFLHCFSSLTFLVVYFVLSMQIFVVFASLLKVFFCFVSPMSCLKQKLSTLIMHSNNSCSIFSEECLHISLKRNNFIVWIKTSSHQPLEKKINAIDEKFLSSGKLNEKYF